MNWVQRWTLIVGLLLIVGVGVYPPAIFVYRRGNANVYLSDGRTWLWAGRRQSEERVVGSEPEPVRTVPARR